MSNTNTPKHRIPLYRRPLFLGGMIALVAIVMGIFIFIKLSQSAPESESGNQPSDQPSVSQPDTNPDNPETSDPDPSDEPERLSQYEGGDPNKLPELTGFISYRNADQSAGELIISAGIDQYLMSDGTCTLRLKQGDNTAYTTSTAATADITTSVCETFRVPLSQLSPGSYQIEISIDADDKTGLITDSIEL